MEVVASLSQGRTAAAQCGLFTYKSVPVIFEPPDIKTFERAHCFPFPNITVEPNLKYLSISPYIHNRRHYVPPHDPILIYCVSFNA